MLTYYEKGKQVPDSLLFLRLMERMGVSLEEFTLMVSESEYTYVKWQEQVYDAIEKEQWEELGQLLQQDIKGKEWINEKLQKLFFYYAFRYWKRNKASNWGFTKNSMKFFVTYYKKKNSPLHFDQKYRACIRQEYI